MNNPFTDKMAEKWVAEKCTIAESIEPSPHNHFSATHFSANLKGVQQKWADLRMICLRESLSF